jgi:hypothetical protein
LEKQTKSKKTRGADQAVESLPSILEVLSSVPLLQKANPKNLVQVHGCKEMAIEGKLHVFRCKAQGSTVNA